MSEWVDTDRPVLEHKTNLETLHHAFVKGSAVLMECVTKVDIPAGTKVAALTVVWSETEGAFTVTPFAIMLNGDPHELLEPPEGVQ